MRFLPSTIFRRAACWAALFAATLAGPAAAQLLRSETPPGPVGGVPAQLPQIRLPEMGDIRLPVPRPVQAAQAALGLGRQRLALVVGLGTVGTRRVVDSAARDTLAVATALRSSGFVVMQRSDVSSAELRRTLKEFRERLQPGGVGFVYLTGMGAQLEGQNLLLAREAALDPGLAPAVLLAQLRAGAVPLQEVSDALIGPPGSPRLLVVDAAWQHPVLAALPQRGLAEPRLPVGMMALFGHALGSVQEVPAVAALPTLAPTDAVALAATPFARTLVAALLTPRISGPEALRTTRRAIAAATLGQSSPWLGGDTDDREELAETTLLDGLLPRTPEEIAREGARQASRLSPRGEAARAGELPVSEVLQPGGNLAAPPPDGAGEPADKARKLPEVPGNATSLSGAVGTAVSAAGAVAGVAATAAGVAATARAAEAAVVVTAATTAAGTAGSVLGRAAALAARGAVGGEAPAGVVLGQATATGGTGLGRGVAQTALSNAAGGEMGQDKAQPPRGPRAPDGRTQSTAEGGERPVFTPRTNPYGHAQGDTTTWQITDKWKGEVVSEYTTAIEEVLDDGRLLANGQQVQLDAQGRVTRHPNAEGGVSQFEPAQALWWAKPTAGERRTVKYLEKFSRADGAAGQTEWKGSARVGHLRKIETPAGEFEVLPVESSGWWHETLANGIHTSGQWSRTAYYAPKLGHPVAIDIEDLDNLGKRLRIERIELRHAQTARVTP
ncbi:MAG: hypothetical protein Q8K45_12840 [Rubrivivax sp.]|nr:hypothetical protein [Rubrivivax sp.]